MGLMRWQGALYSISVLALVLALGNVQDAQLSKRFGQPRCVGNLWVLPPLGWTIKIQPNTIEFHKEFEQASADIEVRQFVDARPSVLITTSNQLIERMKVNGHPGGTVADIYGSRGRNHSGSGSWHPAHPVAWRGHPAYLTEYWQHDESRGEIKARELVFSNGTGRYSVTYVVTGEPVGGPAEFATRERVVTTVETVWRVLSQRVRFT